MEMKRKLCENISKFSNEDTSNLRPEKIFEIFFHDIGFHSFDVKLSNLEVIYPLLGRSDDNISAESTRSGGAVSSAYVCVTGSHPRILSKLRGFNIECGGLLDTRGIPKRKI